MACPAGLVSKQEAALVGENKSEVRQRCQAMRAHPHPALGLRILTSWPQLLTCPALEGLKSLQLHRHHHTVKAAQVCGGHHTPRKGKSRGGASSAFEVPGGASSLGMGRYQRFPPAATPQAPPHLMSRSSSSFSGLSRIASRGLTRSSTPPSCTYCR